MIFSRKCLPLRQRPFLPTPSTSWTLMMSILHARNHIKLLPQQWLKRLPTHRDLKSLFFRLPASTNIDQEGVLNAIYSCLLTLTVCLSPLTIPWTVYSGFVRHQREHPMSWSFVLISFLSIPTVWGLSSSQGLPHLVQIQEGMRKTFAFIVTAEKKRKNQNYNFYQVLKKYGPKISLRK